MNASKEELLKKLEQLEKERHALADRFYHNSTDDSLDRELDCYDQAITRTEIEYDVALMRDHLISKGASHAALMDNCDCGVYKIAKFEGLRYLEYVIDYYDSKEENPYHLRKLDHGKIVHDEYGNVIFEEHVIDEPNRESYELNNGINYKEIRIDDAFVYCDTKNFIIKTKGETLIEYADQNNKRYRLPETCAAYRHYQLRDGKYVLVNTFIQENKFSSKFNFKLLKTNSSRKLSQCFGRLYDIDKGCYLTKSSFDKILDMRADIIDMPYLGCPLILTHEKILELIKKNDLLVGIKHIEVDEYDTTVDTMVYLDLDGNIVSDLLYYVLLGSCRSSLDQQKEISSIETTDATYNDDLSKIIQLSKDYRAETYARIKAKQNKKNEITSHILKMRNEKCLKFMTNSCNKKN